MPCNSAGALTWLELDQNRLSGTIPSSLGQLTTLRCLWLMGNQLVGTIPPSLSSLTSLYYLGFYSNPLSGTIPLSLSSLTGLGFLYLSGTNICGYVPMRINNHNPTDGVLSPCRSPPPSPYPPPAEPPSPHPSPTEPPSHTGTYSASQEGVNCFNYNMLDLPVGISGVAGGCAVSVQLCEQACDATVGCVGFKWAYWMNVNPPPGPGYSWCMLLSSYGNCVYTGDIWQMFYRSMPATAAPSLMLPPSSAPPPQPPSPNPPRRQVRAHRRRPVLVRSHPAAR
jgi:hypothetical protein